MVSQSPILSYHGVNHFQVIINFDVKEPHRAFGSTEPLGLGDKIVSVFFRTAQEHNGKQALHGKFLIQHLPDGFGLQCAVCVGLGVVQEIDDTVWRCLRNHKMDQVAEVQGNVREFVVAGFLGPVKKLKG